ncbi:HdeD family acid-resistance protein [Roseivirga sp. UBA838]|uniref:HdeD family acid-resistance protein n=1 Tax=Roseivirga sp. UBA838 TaxID=1947393 RepID=UPI002580A773|nr:HdeD family acid-resistance protein [Roseivirga sp. UBA838]|tara:strand:- start:11541 stop:12143 length:603 start_codon:yes stop_codon:yes gene_type:complete
MTTIEIKEGQSFQSTLSTNWWTFIIRGVLALIFAVLAFVLPFSAVLALAIVFGAFAIMDGFFGIVGAVRRIKKGKRWGWLLFSGILGLLAGVFIIISPLVATIVLASFLWASIGLWSVFMGVTEIVTAIRLRKEIKGEIWMALSGVFSLLLGGIIIWMLLTQPEEVLLASGWLLGFNALFSAVTYFMLGFKLRKEMKASK